MSWNLSRDVGATGNQISFNQGAEGVWYFMRGHTTDHNPQLYRFIRRFNAPAVLATGNPAPAGFSQWEEPGGPPGILFNFTDGPVRPEGFDVPPRTVDMHPGPDMLVIVAWKSPVNGNVRIRGSFSDLDANCGNGILWSIDRDEETLLSHDLANGAAQRFDLKNVWVRTSDVLYFIVDPKDFDYVCDSTALDLTISYVTER
jgi:hypothetical protein